MKNILSFLAVFSFIFLLVFFGGSIFTKAESISSDAIDAGGGRSSSGNYILESSLGQFDGGMASNDNSQLNSGYEQSGGGGGTYVNLEIVYPTGGNVAMSSVSGFLSGDTGNGYSDVKVTTDYDGYNLNIKSTTNPAMKCVTSSGCDVSDVFANYTPSGGVGTPDYAWSVGSGDSEFGFTPKGSDILTKFKYNTEATSCGSGSSEPSGGNYCWDALGTSDTLIASSDAPNISDGTTTDIKFRTQIGSSKIQPAGNYQASITVTATSN